MDLFYREIGDTGRGMYLYYPKGECRTAFKRCCVTVLRDGADEDSARYFLERGLRELADENGIVVSFPNPVNGRWNYDFTGDTDDAADFPLFQEAMARPENRPPQRYDNGIPTYWEMMNSWHLMHDTRYLIGFGSGAHMACTLAACYPDNIAAALSAGGHLCDEALRKAVDAPMPIWLLKSTPETLDYFIKANGAVPAEEDDSRRVYRNGANPLRAVAEFKVKHGSEKELFFSAWRELFSKVRRPNTGVHGDCEHRMVFGEAGFEVFLDDERLDEPVKTPHTWFVHVPQGHAEKRDKLPLLLFMHGGSDNPAEAAEMSKFHELGNREGFITVYPWATNKAAWNNDLDENQADDVGFIAALIRYMLGNYPVDPERVYLSGFSNGAAQTQITSMLHPELVAAICPIDTRWPGDTDVFEPNSHTDVKAMNLALEKKKLYDYKMPVWYTYGTREIAFPVYRGRSQQRQYDFWKEYNGIRILETPEKDDPHPCGCGVPGETVEHLSPSVRHPHHTYDVHRFYTDDDARMNLYDYVLMHDKGHDIAEMDPVLGWDYVKRFRRLSDGSLNID